MTSAPWWPVDERPSNQLQVMGEAAWFSVAIDPEVWLILTDPSIKYCCSDTRELLQTWSFDRQTCDVSGIFMAAPRCLRIFYSVQLHFLSLLFWLICYCICYLFWLREKMLALNAFASLPARVGFQCARFHAHLLSMASINPISSTTHGFTPLDIYKTLFGTSFWLGNICIL